MKFKRKMTFDSNTMHFEIGDAFTFRMKNGEKVKAKAVKEDHNGNMLFIFEDCLIEPYDMNEILYDNVFGRIYDKIPKKIRKLMVAFDGGDYLRLPTEKEIFGENVYGEKNEWGVLQFDYMKDFKHRLSGEGYGGMPTFYWLKNKKMDSDSDYLIVSPDGDYDYGNVSTIVGVRPVIRIKNSPYMADA